MRTERSLTPCGPATEASSGKGGGLPPLVPGRRELSPSESEHFPFPEGGRRLKFRSRTSDGEAIPMNRFFWGILTGAFVAWIYASEGVRVHDLVDGLFHLRDTARLSVCGYGGRN
jgi:hypothetical protein